MKRVSKPTCELQGPYNGVNNFIYFIKGGIDEDGKEKTNWGTFYMMCKEMAVAACKRAFESCFIYKY